MKLVEIELGDRSYEIAIGSGLLGSSDQIVPWIASEQVFVITNEVVAPLYLEQVEKSLSKKSVNRIILPDGEETKTLTTAEQIFDSMLEIPLSRSATVVALGGGVIGDMAGFAAACYQRGIPFIQVPTTLLSQVDSSVGGKTAVNHRLGKNMIGAFYQPKRVIADISTLSTLDPRQFASGVAEVIKYGVIDDASFFQWLDENMELIMAKDESALEYIVEQSCLNKVRVVEQDEKESGVRALLNLGHTFGHAIENTVGYGTWLHGEAVAQGMVMAAYMSNLAGLMDTEDYEKIRSILARANLPVDDGAGLDMGKMMSAMSVDKKVDKGRIRLVLMKGIGQAFLSDDYDKLHLEKTLERFTLA